MRSLRLTTVAALAVVALAACTGGGEPAWTYEPAPSPTPVVVPSEAPGGSAAPSEAPSGNAIELSAQSVKFDKATIMAPAGQDFQINFVNNDAGVPHNVYIKDVNGTVVFEGETFSGVDSRTYDIKALGAGSYTFYCSLHPSMVGTLTVG